MISECKRAKLFLQFCPAIQGVKTLSAPRDYLIQGEKIEKIKKEIEDIERKISNIRNIG